MNRRARSFSEVSAAAEPSKAAGQQGGGAENAGRRASEVAQGASRGAGGAAPLEDAVSEIFHGTQEGGSRDGGEEDEDEDEGDRFADLGATGGEGRGVSGFGFNRR